MAGNYGYDHSPKNFKEVIIYQLLLIGRASSNIMAMDEKALAVGRKPEEIFELAVKCLDDMLFPVWDEKYVNARAAATDVTTKKLSPHKLLQAEMGLITRVKILVMVEDAEALDDWEDEQAAEEAGSAAVA